MASVFKRQNRRGRRAAKWTVGWWDAEREKWRYTAAHSDKQASQALGTRLERESARRAEGLDDPAVNQRQRPLEEHLADFVLHLKAQDRVPLYVSQVEFRIRRVIDAIKASRFQDLDPVKVEAALPMMRYKGRALSGVTRNEYLTSIKAFTRWVASARRIADPLAILKRIEAKRIAPVHPRRALTPAEAGRLLDAAARRPLLEVKTVRRGRHRGEPRANIRPWVVAKMDLLGRERRLAYMIVMWTGLRRSELRALNWGDLHLDHEVPHIRLRATTTKSKRADTLALHPQLVAELKAMRPRNATPGMRVLSAVPDMKCMVADLKLAGIEYGDVEMGFADFHAQRVTLNTMMASHKVSQRSRQAQLRHTDPRLTENTYLDENLLPIAGELSKVPPIPVVIATPPARPEGVLDPSEELRRMLAAKGVPAQAPALLGDPLLAQSRAVNAQYGAVATGQNWTQSGTSMQVSANVKRLVAVLAKTLEMSRSGTKRQDPAPIGTGSFQERVKGLEPSTFTLARGLEAIVKCLDVQGVETGLGVPNSANDSAQSSDLAGPSDGVEMPAIQGPLAWLPLDARMGMLAGLALVDGEWKTS